MSTPPRSASVRLVHCDYTPNSGPLRVRQLSAYRGIDILVNNVGGGGGGARVTDSSDDTGAARLDELP
jgi:hypothetical protein